MLLISAGMALAEEPVVKMATQGRLSLTGLKMESVAVSLGKAEYDEGTWSVGFPVDWWRWQEIELTLVPSEEGQLELSLTGPWGMDGEVELRQELLWDLVGDERFDGGVLPQGWTSPWREYPAAKDWPIDGGSVAASWHGRPLVRSLSLSAGKPLVLKLRVKAAVPKGFVKPRRLTGETEAHRAAGKLKRGMNLGNCWEDAPGSWRVTFTPEDIDRIAEAGFDHVRVPVGWHHRLVDGRPSSELLDELEPVLKRAMKKKLSVILNWQGYHKLNEDPAGHAKRFVEGWRAVAAHFRDWPDTMIFELFNEPSGKLTGEVLNRVHADAVAAIRSSNPDRILMVDPGSWAGTDALGALHLPDDDNRIIASFHCYDPFRFTHQGAEWVGLENVNDVRFGDVTLAVFERRLDDALAWSRHFGRPVHLGEFGATSEADIESRRQYAAAVREAAEKREIPWCWWEWKAGFRSWDETTGKALLIDSLMGK